MTRRHGEVTLSQGRRNSQHLGDESGRRTAANLFGQVRKLKATGQHQLDPASILEDLERRDGVVHYFCKGCGVVFEVSREGAERLAALAGVLLPATIDRNTYFEGDGCDVCDGDRRIVRLKRI